MHRRLAPWCRRRRQREDQHPWHTYWRWVFSHSGSLSFCCSLVRLASETPSYLGPKSQVYSTIAEFFHMDAESWSWVLMLGLHILYQSSHLPSPRNDSLKLPKLFKAGIYKRDLTLTPKRHGQLETRFLYIFVWNLVWNGIFFVQRPKVFCSRFTQRKIICFLLASRHSFSVQEGMLVTGKLWFRERHSKCWGVTFPELLGDLLWKHVSWAVSSRSRVLGKWMGSLAAPNRPALPRVGFRCSQASKGCCNGPAIIASCVARKREPSFGCFLQPS